MESKIIEEMRALLCEANGVGKDEPPNVTDTPGVRYAVTESDILVMRYCKVR